MPRFNMSNFVLFAEPWWVNLLIVIPFVAYFLWRRGGLRISNSVLIYASFFGIAFGFVEASVVVYLRAAAALFLRGTAYFNFADISANVYQQAEVVGNLPQSLYVIEFFREAATIIMLMSVSALATKSLRERLAIFLWIFALWDIFYYAGLWITVRWPSSLTTPDVLFLIPVPWFSEVWFPLLVSLLSLLAVLIMRKSHE